MRALLDTHVFLWWVAASSRLSPSVRDLLADRTNEVYVSTVVSWEIAIKVSLGRLTLTGDIESEIADQIRINEFRLLVIGLPHTCRVSVLPFHHRDPFDRLLIAQAQIEGLTILTRDPQFQYYEVPILW